VSNKKVHFSPMAIWQWIVAVDSPAADNLLPAADSKEGKTADN